MGFFAIILKMNNDQNTMVNFQIDVDFTMLSLSSSAVVAADEGTALALLARTSEDSLWSVEDDSTFSVIQLTLTEGCHVTAQQAVQVAPDTLVTAPVNMSTSANPLGFVLGDGLNVSNTHYTTQQAGIFLLTYTQPMSSDDSLSNSTSAVRLVIDVGAASAERLQTGLHAIQGTLKG
jgi:hypothetical protein